MRINSVNGSQNFKGARINFILNSDNHGNLNNLPDLYNAIWQNRRDIFQKAEEKSTLNMYINAGDFYMNGSKKGFLSNPEKTNGEIQQEFFQKFIQKIYKAANTNAYELNKRFEKNGPTNRADTRFAVLMTPGNHDFDGGDDLYYKLINKTKDVTLVTTNVDIKNSPLYRYYFQDSKNFVQSKEFEIPDDKDPNKKHHLLVLGATIPATDFYNPNLLTGTKFVDTNAIKDSKMGENEIKNTIISIKRQVGCFKEKYPQGIVFLISHMGTKLSKITCDKVKGINEIFDGHKHDITTTMYKGTLISSLGMDNNIIKAIALQLDDDGNVEQRESRVYCADQYRLEKVPNSENSIQRLLTKTYGDDYKPLIKINSGNTNIKSLEYKPDIRYSNSYLANFLTTAIKKTLNKETNEDVQIVGIQSSIIRGGIQNGSNNFDILKVFDGVSESLSDIKTGNVSGEELAGIILENIRDNIKAPTRNTIIHWSDIKIDKDRIVEKLNETSKEDLNPSLIKNFIMVRRGENKPYLPLNFEDEYKIALADKYLKKEDIEYPKKIRDRFESTGETYNSLFVKYLRDNDYKILMDKKYEETRIKFDNEEGIIQ